MSMFGWLKGRAIPPAADAPAAPFEPIPATPDAATAKPQLAPPAEPPMPVAAPQPTAAAPVAAMLDADPALPSSGSAQPTTAAATPAEVAATGSELVAAKAAEAAASHPTPDAALSAEQPPAGTAAVEPPAAADATADATAEPLPDAAPTIEFSLFAAVDQVMAEPSSWPEDPVPEPPRPNHGIEATLTLARPGQLPLEVPLAAAVLGSIIDNLPDHQSLEELYDLVAEHPSAQVRLAVARKDQLGEEALRRLSEAREFYVLERLLASGQFRAQVSHDRLLAILDLHPELARDVAGSYASFLNCAAGALLAYLGGHRDPGVRLALVENYSANAGLLRRFTTDPDPGVQAAARRRLSEA